MTKYDTQSIEKMGAYLVDKTLRKVCTLDPQIPTGDKKLSWDGEIIVYKGVPFSKKNFRTKIPTQVKTRTLKSYKKTYSIKIDDLKNYKQNNNIIYFLVEFVDSIPKIYYASLSLYDLTKYTKNTKKTSISVGFEELPTSEEAIAAVIERHIVNVSKQKMILPHSDSVAEFQKYNPGKQVAFNLDLPYRFTASDIIKAVNEQKPYVYYSPEEDVTFPIDRLDVIRNLRMENRQKIVVEVGDEVLFDEIVNVSDGSREYIKLGKGIEVTLTDVKADVKYRDVGDISNRIACLRFVIACMANEEIKFNGIPLKLNDVKSDKNIASLHEKLGQYKDIEKLLKVLGVYKTLDIGTLSQSELDNLYMFSQSELYDKTVALGNKNGGHGLLKIGNLQFLCYCAPTDVPGMYRVYNFFKPNLLVATTADGLPISIYMFLLRDEFSPFRIDNINYDDLIASLDCKMENDEYSEQYTRLLLALLNYYDYSKYAKVLEACRWIVDFQCKNFYNDIAYINWCQVKIRTEMLSFDDKEKLLKIKETSSDNQIKLGCSILLHSKEEIQLYLSKLNDEERDEFVKYPIYHLI